MDTKQHEKKTEKQVFVQWVMDRLVYHPPAPEDGDVQIIGEMVSQQFRMGYTKEDALAEMNLTEHVNPSLSERYACDEMAKISGKYHPAKEK